MRNGETQRFNTESKVGKIDIQTENGDFLEVNTNRTTSAAKKNAYLEAARWSNSGLDAFRESKAHFTTDECLKLVSGLLEKHIQLVDPSYANVIAAWILGTYFYTVFPAYPYICVEGVSGSGKSKLLSIIAALSFNGRMLGAASSASATRLIHETQATICFDEAENLNKARRDSKNDLITLANVGYKNDGVIQKMIENKSNGWEPFMWNVYSPKAFGSTLPLEDTIRNRSLIIHTQKSYNQTIANSLFNKNDKEVRDVRDALYTHALEHALTIEQFFRQIQSQSILGRNWEIWRPLLAIAYNASLEFYPKLLSIAEKTSIEKLDAETEANPDISVLDVLESIFAARREDVVNGSLFITLKEVHLPLLRLDDHFAQYYKTTKDVATILRKMGLITGKSIQKKIKKENIRGYEINEQHIANLRVQYGYNPSL